MDYTTAYAAVTIEGKNVRRLAWPAGKVLSWNARVRNACLRTDGEWNVGFVTSADRAASDWIVA